MRSGWKGYILILLISFLVGGRVLASEGAELFPGGVAFIEARAGEREALFRGHRFPLLYYQGTRGFLIAAPLGTPPGDYTVVIKGAGRRSVKVRVRPKEYPEEHLRLPERMVRFSPEVLRRVKRELAIIKGVLSRPGGVCRWHKPFRLPARGRITSPFGLKRILNGEPRSPHSGIDIGVPEGTPIKASQDGTVALTGEFYLPGKVVILSHGCRVYTYYAHLSKILVAEGDKVKAGQVIGLSGSSGRATGPHLHFGLYLSGIKVDPLYAIKLLEEAYGPRPGG